MTRFDRCRQRCRLMTRHCSGIGRGIGVPQTPALVGIGRHRSRSKHALTCRLINADRRCRPLLPAKSRFDRCRTYVIVRSTSHDGTGTWGETLGVGK